LICRGSIYSYEKEPRNDIEQMKRLLRDQITVTHHRTDKENSDATGENTVRYQALDELLKQMGADKRSAEVKSTSTWRAPFARLQAALKDVDNVFTQHRPQMLDVLTALKANPKMKGYPFATNDVAPARYPLLSISAQLTHFILIIVFYITC
jgi:hypothetical protein